MDGALCNPDRRGDGVCSRGGPIEVLTKIGGPSRAQVGDVGRGFPGGSASELQHLVPLCPSTAAAEHSLGTSAPLAAERCRCPVPAPQPRSLHVGGSEHAGREANVLESDSLVEIEEGPNVRRLWILHRDHRSVASEVFHEVQSMTRDQVRFMCLFRNMGETLRSLCAAKTCPAGTVACPGERGTRGREVCDHLDPAGHQTK